MKKEEEVRKGTQYVKIENRKGHDEKMDRIKEIKKKIKKRIKEKADKNDAEMEVKKEEVG